jgi:hypothetical protein
MSSSSAAGFPLSMRLVICRRRAAKSFVILKARDAIDGTWYPF